MSNKWDTDEVIQRFREYLRIPSVHPNVDYDRCVEFLQDQAHQLDLPVRVYEIVPKKPVVVITWQGLEPQLSSIMLNSHMDVVPALEEHWTYPPFEAHITDDGLIYARGTQDMKSIGMMHLEAVRRLKFSGLRLKRTVHISFVPDEEIGGVDGMKAFSQSKAFKDLNIGFELDESIPSTYPNTIIAFNGERISRHIKITCAGVPGHGSTMPVNTAGEKMSYILNEFRKVRDEERTKMEQGSHIGDILNMNLTKLEGGIQINVLPEHLSASFDVRIPATLRPEEFDMMIDTWCAAAGEGVTWEHHVKNIPVDNTCIDGSLAFWSALKEAVEDMGYSVHCVRCPAETDARYVRQQGVPAISFSPLLNTPLLLHAHDETVHVDEFKRGIDIMEKVVQNVANV